MRTAGKTKRELAVTAALLGMVGAEVRCDAEHECLDTDENREYSVELEAIGRRLEDIAEILFDRAQPEIPARG